MRNSLNKLQLIILAVLVVAVSVTFFILPDRLYSENENRSLETSPELTADNIFSGEYTEKFGSYFADQFPLRDGFVGVKAYLELALGKGENNGVIYAENDTLIPRPNITEDRLDENIKAIAEFSKNTSANVIVAALPRMVDVFSELLPKTYPFGDDNLVWNNLKKSANENSVCLADIYDLLCDSNAYYRTDHHYTTKGAYITYNALGDLLGFNPYDEAYFNKQTASDDFCGTAMRSSGFYLTLNDTIELYRYRGDEDYDIVADGKRIDLYDMDKLRGADKYAVFLGGNHARVDITKSGENREKLLVIRDSFADSIAPFLALHFDLTLLDLRYFNGNPAALAIGEGFDKVLILENISELSSARNLSRLRMK